MSLDSDDPPPPSPSVWELFRRDEPEPRAVQAAYQRFLLRRPEPLSPLRLVRWLVVGFVVGGGVALAANAPRLFPAGRSVHERPLVADAAQAARTRARAPAREPLTPSALPPSDSAAPPQMPASAGVRPSGSALHVVLPEPATTDPKWRRAAAALRAHDYDAAETALREVERAGAAADREAASLALAQVLLTRGRVVEARARLQRLSARARLGGGPGQGAGAARGSVFFGGPLICAACGASVSMGRARLKTGRAVAGVVTVVAACAPMSVDLEHARADGEAGEAGTAANISGAGGSSRGAAAGGATGGNVGRSGAGATGVPSGGASGTVGTGGAPVAKGDAGEGTSGASDGAPPACGEGALSDVRNGHDLLPGYSAPPDPRIATWLDELGLSGQMLQMQGVASGDYDYQDIQRSADVPLPAEGDDLRGYKYRSGSRGLNLFAGQPDRPSDGNDFSTAFPAASIRGASWDPDLEWQVGEAIGDETAASNNDLLIGPSANVLRHPYSGRAQDDYGEDTYHVGRMGAAFTAGVQQRIGACAQHFGASGVEKGERRSSTPRLTSKPSARSTRGRSKCSCGTAASPASWRRTAR